MHQIGDLLAKTDVLVVAFDDLLFNMVLLRTNSVVVVIDNESEKHEAYHRAFATLGNELTLRYVVVKEKDLLEGRLTPFIQQFSEFIQGKYTDSSYVFNKHETHHSRIYLKRQCDIFSRYYPISLPSLPNTDPPHGNPGELPERSRSHYYTRTSVECSARASTGWIDPDGDSSDSFLAA